MGRITSARAWANNEVAYVAWDIDEAIEGCLGFEVVRTYLNSDGTVVLRDDGKEDRVTCAAWVPFKGQRNPYWIPQDTGVWPVQKLSWRDLTLRKRRQKLQRRPADVHVRYEIRPVGDLQPGLEPVPHAGPRVISVVKRDENGRPVTDAAGNPLKIDVKEYAGKPRPLGYLGDAVATNDVMVTARRGVFRSTFTNGILAAQWLRNVLMSDGVIESDELIRKIADPSDPVRKYLSGDVLPLIHDVFSREGEFFLALYELEDEELVDLLVANKSRIHVILANSAAGTGENKNLWDVRNSQARRRLIDAGVDVQHRMFNNSVHIGHNKFVVHVPSNGGPRSVLTGSTNWTATGVAGQTNNALLVEHDAVAGAFLDYWRRLHDGDPLPVPQPFSAPMPSNQPGAALRGANKTPARIELGDGVVVQTWFSPNRPERKKPTSKTKPTPVPPDLEEVYRRMRLAREAILFLAFYPGQSGRDCIIGEAVNIGLMDRSLLVAGAVSSPQAMPNFVPKKTAQDADSDEVDEGASPVTFIDDNVSIVRAARLDERSLLADFGVEQLTAKGGVGAIIHDKIVVIDPRSPDCTVVLGSHNCGYKASYSNDENMLIISGDQALAAAYAVHVLDVYDHYRFRAIENERVRQGKKRWTGFLDTDDRWQRGYVDKSKGALMRYFAK